MRTIEGIQRIQALFIAGALTATTISCKVLDRPSVNQQSQQVDAHLAIPEQTMLGINSTRDDVLLRLRMNLDPKRFSGIFSATYEPRRIQLRAEKNKEELIEQIPLQAENLYFNVHLQPFNHSITSVLMEAYQIEPHQSLFSVHTLAPNDYSLMEATLVWTPNTLAMFMKEGSFIPQPLKVTQYGGIALPFTEMQR